MDTSRLSKCGWASFTPGLFLGEPGRKKRDLSQGFLSVMRNHCGGKAVLELCCGAGKLCLDMGRAGYDVTGIDLDERMLAVARDALDKEPLETRQRVTFTQEDATRFALGKEYDFIILEDDGFVYLLDSDDQIACLTRVRDHLGPEGRFLLVFTTPQHEFDPNSGASGVTQYDPIRQVNTVECSWTVVDDQGSRSQIAQGIERRRMTYSCELELLLKMAGLKVIHRWGNLDCRPFDNPCEQDYHYLCQKG